MTLDRRQLKTTLLNEVYVARRMPDEEIVSRIKSTLKLLQIEPSTVQVHGDVVTIKVPSDKFVFEIIK